MDNNKKKLFDIFDDDDLGLLDVKQKTPIKNENDRLVDSFKEIIEFYKGNNREPELSGSIKERTLYYRLKGIRENEHKVNLLAKHDPFSLLEKEIEEKEIKTIDDILNSDTLGIFENDAESIFNLKHVQKETNMPDYVARRKPCKNFDEYEHLFTQCQADLTAGKRQLLPFKNEQQIEKGYFFVLKGVLLFVVDVGKRKQEKGKTNARLRCIFENGTESDMLLRSLSAELYKHGRRVTEVDENLLDGFNNVSNEDIESGYIYILKSKSDKPEIKSLENLYKIGFSKTKVESRIRNAEQEPTYLMAPVSIVTAYKCYNMNPQKFEKLLHNFFGSACLDVEIFDKEGQRHQPREWFIAPLSIIEQAVKFIINEDIVNYRYDPVRQIIVGK